MAIQLRRGASANYDATKMLSGEVAIFTDTDEMVFKGTNSVKVLSANSQTLTSTEKNNARENIIGAAELAYNGGATGVTAYVSGNHVVTVLISRSSSVTLAQRGWATLDTLPSGIRPADTLRFVGYDDGASSHATNSAVDFKIDSSGVVSVFLWQDNCSTGVKPMATITYVV